MRLSFQAAAFAVVESSIAAVDTSPMATFSRFIIPDMLDTIVSNTNKYRNRHGDKSNFTFTRVLGS
ncbi:hypothetical protein PI126_g19536 [Phytophthora idaei]|nr:hypothetical protein PI126_g19536 [Phytophthora idaei]